MKILNWEAILWDCIETMKTLPENSVDAIVTDPPYEIGFMWKSWDNTWIANNTEMWKEALRVLKPGGHLLSFWGTRTYHRMACAIEDAGFEVRDIIEWCYGSGFPKSLNIAKSIESKLKNGSYAKNNFHQLGAFDLEATTQEAQQWEGWGTALKPAHEPVCMARKPLSEKTVADNCLKWGTGGINIDGSRVGTEIINIHNAPKGTFAGGEPDRGSDTESYRDSVGRFPANLIHDNSEEVRECFPDSKAGSYKGEGSKSGGIWSESTGKPAGMEYGDSGNASRFFKSIIYQAKASKIDRWEWNIHSTVKPTKLMEYLINMITREWQVVLDPFAWSFTTWVACQNLNRKFIMIEKEKEYFNIWIKRIESVQSLQSNLIPNL